MGCIIVLWGWDKRQTKSRNKQTNKDNKIYLGWEEQILRNKSWEEQILRLGAPQNFQKKYGKQNVEMKEMTRQ